MKTIQDFITGKIVRMEAEDRVRAIVDGDPHPDFGRLEAQIEGQGARVTFYEEGLQIANTQVRYDTLAKVMSSPPEAGRRRLGLGLQDGTGVILDLPETVADLVFATVRWIGRAQLQRRLD